MKSSSDLRSMLKNIDRKGYPAYKGTYGIYDFGNYYLSIDHVQGDPFVQADHCCRCSHRKNKGNEKNFCLFQICA